MDPSPNSRNKALESLTVEMEQAQLEDSEERELKTLDRYQYNPLSTSDSIRVFQFHETRSQLECTIREIKLSDGGYTALSYEWGSHETPFRMIVRDHDGIALGYVPLTINLRSALADLRDTQGLESGQYWIDQITIDQSDNLEKGHQVKLMKDVYRNAFQVITYLGPHAQDMEGEAGALKLLSRIDTHFRPNYKYINSQSIEETYRYNLSELPVKDPPDNTFGNDPSWPALLSIVFGAWLRRLWMVQENILCSNTTMLRGRQELDWFSVAAIPILFYLELLPREVLNLELKNLRLTYDPGADCGPLSLTWDARHSHIYEKGESANFCSLAENLAFYDNLDCADPRDRIFAVLGVSKSASVLGIEPNYKIPVHQLYTQVSKRILIQDQDLYLLEVVGSQEVRSHSPLPTWAFAGTAHCMMDLFDFQPHPQKHSNIRFEDNDKIMVCKGLIVRQLRIVSEPVDWITFDLTRKDWIRFYIQIFELFSFVVKDAAKSGNSVTALVFAIIADPAWTSTILDATFYTWCFYRYLIVHLHAKAPDLVERQKPVCDEIQDATALLHRLLGDDDRVVHAPPWSPLTSEENQVGSELWSRILVEGRSIGITESDDICNVTGRAQQGDVLALLAGGELAYILRPFGDKYQYIGSAYHHEFVNGAAYRDMSPEEVDQEIQIV
ncbi:heterokaryon incompatibility protein-domain-containing protein [Tricladium varicosporioides]|nr:heterokaryon incompatibility protein-domain-containing protein [Hymenoscyphus varicosporioides]